MADTDTCTISLRQPTAQPVTRFLPTLARLAISDGTAFVELLHQSANQLGMPYDQLAAAVLQKWLDRVSRPQVCLFALLMFPFSL